MTYTISLVDEIPSYAAFRVIQIHFYLRHRFAAKLPALTSPHHRGKATQASTWMAPPKVDDLGCHVAQRLVFEP